MEIKNIACIVSGIILYLEMVADKAKMSERDINLTYVDGTRVLLRMRQLPVSELVQKAQWWWIKRCLSP